MKNRPLNHLFAWGLVGIAVLGWAEMIYRDLAGCNFFIDFTQTNPARTFGGINVIFWGLGITSLGSLIIMYRPENRIGWLVTGLGTAGALGFLSTQYGFCSLEGFLNLPNIIPTMWLIAITNWLMLMMLGLFLLTFPNGRFLSPGWQRLSLVLIVLLSIYIPFAITPTITEDSGSFVIPLNLLPLSGIISLFLRWRVSQGDVRQQIKWLTFFLMTSLILFLGVETFGVIAYPAIFEGWLYFFVITQFFLGFPVVLGLSIFKYRLYDIDIIIRRTLQYTILTGILALIYYGGVITLQAGVRALTGQGNSPLITVITTLAIAALFNPLRYRVQHFIDRRFYRKKYDAEQALAEFATITRDEVDMDKLAIALLGVVEETMQPEKVSLWIKPQQEKKSL